MQDSQTHGRQSLVTLIDWKLIGLVLGLEGWSVANLW